ncbi:MAG: fluoride efflux transporter CrcB [Zoogloeaceae bacterium]|jgi:CrcB protein|nr:fluoride efflux transporter CrcB [Zoogloeaceae bacterium]
MTNVTGLSAALAIGLGGGLGACARWGLGILLNPIFPLLPLGTLAANLIGGYLVGVVVGLFHLHSSLDPLLKLFLITGVLGGLTTFSTFSAETVERLISGRVGYALLLCVLHLTGSLLMTWLGLLSVGARRIFAS